MRLRRSSAAWLLVACLGLVHQPTSCGAAAGGLHEPELNRRLPSQPIPQAARLLPPPAPVHHAAAMGAARRRLGATTQQPVMSMQQLIATKPRGMGYRPRIVPGQAFHDKRTADLAANFSNAPDKWTIIVGERERATSKTQGAVSLSHPSLTGDAQYFVTRRNGGVTFTSSGHGSGSSDSSGSSSSSRGGRNGVLLEAGGKPFLVAGFNAPGAVQLAADVNGTRQQVRELLATAQGLGLNVMCTWASTDGSGPGRGSPSMQPYPGVLDEQTMRDGLDWLVAEARKYNMRLLLSFVDGSSSASHGGMMQYTQWVDPQLRVTEFFTNDTIKSVFLDYMAGILTRVNSITGIRYRNDPTILGWELAHAPRDPGHPGSLALEAWVRQMGTFVRQKDPNHLIAVGFEGFFGPTSPHLLRHNPPAQVKSAPLAPDVPYDAACEGADFYTQQNMVVLDLVVMQLLPDEWLACDTACKLAWSQQWVGAHLKDAVRMQKPLLISAFGTSWSGSWRSDLMAQAYKDVEHAAETGHPVAGSIFGRAAIQQPSHADGLINFANTSMTGMQASASHSPAEVAAAIEAWEQQRQRFYNREEMAACLRERAKETPADDAGTHIFILQATGHAARLRHGQAALPQPAPPT